MNSTGRGIVIRRADERGHTRLPWLDSHHSFSFGHYQDPAHQSFHNLRVINDDRIAPGGGFPEHPHRDMEIITWVLQGGLAHRDNLGNGSAIRPGDVQVMTAGTGIRHSEFNASQDAPVHLLQMWLLPLRAGLTPRYEQRAFPPEARRDRLCLIGSSDGRDESIPLMADAALFIADLGPGRSVRYDLTPGRAVWVHISRASVELEGQSLAEGDGAAIEGLTGFEIVATGEAQVLLFDLP